MTFIRSHSREDLFLTLTLLFEVVLIGVTWPLWTEFQSFPAVPALAMLAGVPVMADRILLCVLLCVILCLITGLLWKRTAVDSGDISAATGTGRKPALLMSLALISAIGLALLNQHRLQSWHWLFILVIAQSLFVPLADRRRIHRLTIASIYIFAAVSRLGPDVAGGMSRQVVSVIFRTAGFVELLKNGHVIFVSCLAMSLTELAVGMLLIPARTRKLAVIAAVVLHLTLLLVLSPLGLDHHPGVLIWNLYFVMAVPLLFTGPDSAGRPAVIDGPSLTCSLAGRLFAVFVIAFPLSGLFGIADNWLSWQVYSPRPEVVRVLVRQSAVDGLPEDVRAFVGRPAPLDDWCPVRIDRWSLKATGAPIYPEDRFQLAVAASLISRIDEANIRVEIESPDVPMWWRRTTSQLTGRDEIRQRLNGHLLNGPAIRNADL